MPDLRCCFAALSQKYRWNRLGFRTRSNEAPWLISQSLAQLHFDLSLQV
jgi:hypothetical protein